MSDNHAKFPRIEIVIYDTREDQLLLLTIDSVLTLEGETGFSPQLSLEIKNSLLGDRYIMIDTEMRYTDVY